MQNSNGKSLIVCSLPAFIPLTSAHSRHVRGGLAAGLFFAEVTLGPIWAMPMDIVCRYSGAARSMMKTGSAWAAIIPWRFRVS
jgi:ACS family glucarate transporter-like MFS transporter